MLAVLEQLANHPGGIRLDDLARSVNSPAPTVHRALATLRRRGLAVQDSRGWYSLGDEFLRLAFAHHERHPDHVRVMPRLQRLAERYGETSHYAVLSEREVIYRAKVDPDHGAIRLSSVVGGRNPAHATAVGKVLLAHLLPDMTAVVQWCRGATLERRTPNTITDHHRLASELDVIRARGFALDREENELGVHCVAVPVYFDSPSRPSGAVSVSAVSYRTSLESLVSDLEELKAIVAGGSEGPSAGDPISPAQPVR